MRRRKNINTRRILDLRKKKNKKRRKINFNGGEIGRGFK